MFRINCEKNAKYIFQSISIDSGTLWTPDLLLYNSANENFDSKYPSNLIVYNNTKVEQIPPGIKEF